MVTELETLTLTDLINQFIERPNLSPKTRGYYTDILWKFEWFARNQGWPTKRGLELFD